MHELQRPSQKRKKRVGRGGKRGTYSGRGMKGQKSRAGAGIRPEFRDYLKRIPKLRGAGTSLNTRSAFAAVQIRAIEKSFADGDVISPTSLCNKKLVSRVKGRLPAVKIIGSSALTKTFVITHCTLSSGARTLIEKAGGTIR